MQAGKCRQYFRVKFFGTIRADTVADVGLGVFVNIDVDLLPIPAVVADFFTEGAQGQDAPQGADLV